jgi:hypothetical protein
MTMPFYAGSTATAAGIDSLAPQIGVSAGQTVNSTTPVGVTGMSFPVAAATYLVACWFVIDANSGGQARFRFTGPAASLTLMGITTLQQGTLTYNPNGQTSNGTGYNTGDIDAPVSGTFATAFHIVQIWATFTFTAPGTLALECANAAGASDTFEIYPGSQMSVLQQQP